MKPLFTLPTLHKEDYDRYYQASIKDPEGFWRQELDALDWIKKPTKIKDTSFDEKDFHIHWFQDGILNVSYNCIDRHLEARGDQTAILFIGNDAGESQKISYQELHKQVCRYANGLKKLGVTKGDRVALYMPMIPDAAYVMLACARIGAIHSVVFGGFSAFALAGRLDDCTAKVIVTADLGKRGEKTIPLKETVDLALRDSKKKSVEHCLVVQTHPSHKTPMKQGRDLFAHDLLEDVQENCPPEEMNAEDPLFILYTSGSTGQPKGVLHTSGGYLLYAMLTHKIIFDIQQGDRYWCSADVGWITGHSYVVYGPLANGITTVMYEGLPNYPTPARFWEEIDQHQITKFYTAPTAIRALMREGDDYLNTTSRDSLKVLGSVGEPLNPEAYHWYETKVGQGKCPIVDTWWQTETGGIMITPLPATTTHKAGSVTKPFFGIEPALLDQHGHEIEGEGHGSLVLKTSWPGQMRGVYGDSARFFTTYFKSFKGVYTSGDGAKRDQEGDYWITGRMDDVINVSGHRIGTAEVEAAINNYPAIAESAVVGMPDAIKGEGIMVFAIPKVDHHGGDAELEKGIKDIIRKDIGPIASPDKIMIVPRLPKTRSGKIMRRILRKLASGEYQELGDISTLADPEIVDLIKHKLS